MDRIAIIADYTDAYDYYGSGRYNVIAQTKKGERFILAGYAVQDKARAEKMAARVAAKGSIDPELWVDGYPVYGSQAYEDEAFEASCYADGLRSGSVHWDNIPDQIRTLL